MAIDALAEWDHRGRVERGEVAELRDRPGEDRSPARPGEHDQREQPEHVLLGPHLAEDQEGRDHQERQLGQEGAARGEQGDRPEVWDLLLALAQQEHVESLSGLGTTTLALLASAQGAGPFLAACALTPGRAGSEGRVRQVLTEAGGEKGLKGSPVELALLQARYWVTQEAPRAAAQLDFAPAAAVVIGDKSTDVELVRRVGATTILVAAGGTASDGRPARADYRVQDLIEAARLIEPARASCPPGSALKKGA